jgi:acyl-coenzyme A thioesterase PaaI-like protein
MDSPAAMRWGGRQEPIAAPHEWAGWTLWAGGDAFEEFCGPYYWREHDDGRRVCGFMPARQHMNGRGFLNGGAAMAFVDYSIFVIARDALSQHQSVTATLNGEFVGTARVGDRVECRGEVVKAGRSMVFVRGLLVNAGADETMMSFSAVIKKTAPRTGERADG